MNRSRGFTAALIALSILFVLAAAEAAEAARTHVVQPGETLFRIALRYGVTVESMTQANRLTDPARILPGQVLTIPGRGPRQQINATVKRALGHTASWERGSATTYTVRRGDTLFSIARRYGTTVRTIMEANRARSEAIRVGQRLVIPAPLPSRGIPRQVAAPKPFTPSKPPAPTPSPEASAAPGVSSPPLQLVVGEEFVTPKPLRVRLGPKMYLATLALVAAGTPLRVISGESGWYEVQLPGGDVGWISEEELRVKQQPAPPDQPASPPDHPGVLRGRELVREAMRYLGTRYVWGGESSRGVDCSGFIYIVFSNYISDLERVSSFDYFRMGTPVDQGSLQPGDLVFFTTYARGASHVGIYVGDRKFIQASSAARQVTISSLDEPYYAARYVGARRLARP